MSRASGSTTRWVNPAGCWIRVSVEPRLTAKGVLRGAHMELDPRALGIGLEAMIAVRLGQHSRELVNSFRAHALEQPEVVSVYHVAGEDDFLVHVAVRDADHRRDFTMDAFTTRPEVAHLRSSLIYEHARDWSLPNGTRH